MKSSEDVIAKSLEGDHRPEHLFALASPLAAFRYYQQLVLEADREIQLQLAESETAPTAQPATPARTKPTARYARHYEPRIFDLRGELYRVFGVDLTNVPGISALTAQTILREIDTKTSQREESSTMHPDYGLCGKTTLIHAQSTSTYKVSQLVCSRRTRVGVAFTLFRMLPELKL